MRPTDARAQGEDPREEEGRDWGDAPTSQGTARADQQTTSSGERSLVPPCLRRSPRFQHLDFGLLASGTMMVNFSCLNHPACCTVWQRQETDTHVSRVPYTETGASLPFVIELSRQPGCDEPHLTQRAAALRDMKKLVQNPMTPK